MFHAAPASFPCWPYFCLCWRVWRTVPAACSYWGSWRITPAICSHWGVLENHSSRLFPLGVLETRSRCLFLLGLLDKHSSRLLFLLERPRGPSSCLSPLEDPSCHSSHLLFLPGALFNYQRHHQCHQIHHPQQPCHRPFSHQGLLCHRLFLPLLVQPGIVLALRPRRCHFSCSRPQELLYPCLPCGRPRDLLCYGLLGRQHPGQAPELCRLCHWPPG